MAKNGERKGARDDRAAVESRVRKDLLDVQSQLMGRNFSVIVVINAVEAEPANEVLNALFRWFDPRYLLPHALREREGHERGEPFLRRYWKQIPPDGRIAVFFGGWILDAFREHREGHLDLAAFAQLLLHIQRMERQLVAEGTHLVKIWVGPTPDLDDPALRLFRDTDWELAEWKRIDGEKKRDRNLAAGRALADSLARRLRRGRHPTPVAPAPTSGGTAPRLSDLDLSSSLDREEYRERRDKLQKRLAKLSAKCVRKDVGAVCAFEGWDAAGKGGAIRRLAQGMDARNYKIVPVAAPNEDERRRPHLWRFWLRLPRPGCMTLFDRSWYGRVLVERVEGFASEADWQRAYGEINDFEEQIRNKGFALCKFWLHIDPDEQLRRFRDRERTPYKQFKITADDYRNREKWDAYVSACDEMFERTSTEAAPWTLVAANDKYHARIHVLEEVCAALERALDAR